MSSTAAGAQRPDPHPPRVHPSRAHPPWYRQFWPWFLICLPGTAVLGSIVTIVIAVRTAPDMVVDDYGRIDRITEERLARRAAASRLAVAAELVLRGERVEVLLDIAGGQAPQRLTLSLRHPTRAALDAELLLESIGARRYLGPLPPIGSRRYLTLKPAEQPAWQLDGVIYPSDERLRLAPEP